jgi:Mn-dependent DtxR family transcriptional regulator
MRTEVSLVPRSVPLSRFGPRQGAREAAHCLDVAKPALTDAIQDYLREIYKLDAEGGRVTVTALAKRLQVSPASASAMVKKLAALELAVHQPYRGITLTSAGERVALEVIRHHRLLELYLAETLDVEVDEVHDEAERLEHVLSEELEARIDKALGFPTHDPHGDPIPDANLRWPAAKRPGREAARTRSGPSAKADRGKGSGETGRFPRA